MLTRAKFTNLKMLRDVELDLKPFTVVIGPNGVGKSTVLDGLQYLFRLPEEVDAFGKSGPYLGPVQTLFVDSLSPEFVLSSDPATRQEGTLFKNDVACLSVMVDFLEEKFANLGFTGWLNQARNFYKTHYTFPTGSDKNLPLQASDSPLHKNTFQYHSYFQSRELRSLASAFRCRLSAPEIAAPSPAAKGTPRIQEDGSGLPTFLNHLIGRRDGSIERVEEIMAHIVRGFRKVHPVERELKTWEQKGINVDGQVLYQTVQTSVPAWSFEVEYEKKGRLPAAHLSEGTLLTLAIAALVNSPTRPRLILLDDIDRALHPRAQIALIEHLHQLVDQTPDLQIITTSHADTVLAGCAPEEVIRLEIGEDGYAEVRPVIGDPRWMTPSEITEAWFGFDQTGLDELLQRYALLASDPQRTPEEEVEVQQLAARLAEAGAQGLPSIKKKRA